MAQSEKEKQGKTVAGADTVISAEKEKIMRETEEYYIVWGGYKHSNRGRWILCREDRYARETEYIDLETLKEWVENWELRRDGLYHSPEERKGAKA